MSYSHIRFEYGEAAEDWDGIAVVTFNRPEKLNALNTAVMDELDDALAGAARNDSVQGLILTGAGEKAFVAGADIRELERVSGPLARETSLRGQAVFRRLETMGKPSIAAINGYALGGGLELAMACTLRVAIKGARLGLPEAKLGLIPGYGGTQRLPRLVGRGRALEMMLTGEAMDAEEACRTGLVNHVVEAGEVLSYSRNLLRKILANAPLSLALIMQTVDSATPVDGGFAFEAAAFGAAASSEDKTEGTRAFLEKRAPNFFGR